MDWGPRVQEVQPCSGDSDQLGRAVQVCAPRVGAVLFRVMEGVQAGWAPCVGEQSGLCAGGGGPWTNVSFTPGKQNQALRLAMSLGCFLPRYRADTESAGAGSSRQGECEHGVYEQGACEQDEWQVRCAAARVGSPVLLERGWRGAGMVGKLGTGVGEAWQGAAGRSRQEGRCWGASPSTQGPPRVQRGAGRVPAWVCWRDRRKSFTSLGVSVGPWGAAWPLKWGSAGCAGSQGSWSWGSDSGWHPKGVGGRAGPSTPRGGSRAVCSTPACKPARQFLLPAACGFSFSRGTATRPGEGSPPLTGCSRGSWSLGGWHGPLSPCTGAA